MAATLALQEPAGRRVLLGEFALAGGLISLGADQVDICRIVAGYVDRVLKGTRPADLPVEQPTKFELVITRRRRSAWPYRCRPCSSPAPTR